MTRTRLGKQQPVTKAASHLEKAHIKQTRGESHYRFSFYYLSQNDIFNFGSNMTHPVEEENSYWTDLLSALALGEQEKVAIFDRDVKMHEYDWSTSPHFSRPKQHEGERIMQFRINKQSRVIGFKDSVLMNSKTDEALLMFNILWIDFHHNHCDSEGYGSLTETSPVPSIFERMQNKVNELISVLAAKESELEDKQLEIDMLYTENQELCDKCKLLQQTSSKVNEQSQAQTSTYFS